MSLRNRWREWRESRAEYADSAEEMRLHIELETERNIRLGMNPRQARREAAKAFGGLDRFAEQARDERTGSCLSDLWFDARFAARGLRKDPLFTITAVLTLALGIGATTSFFSVINAALLRPLPFEDPSSIVKVSLTTAEDADMVWSYPKYKVLAEEQRVFAVLGGYAGWSGNLSGEGVAERVKGEMVTARYFDVLGVRMLVGRPLTEEEASNPGGARVAILSESLWRRRYNADAAITGRTITIDGSPATVVGVAAGFRGLSGVADLFVPVAVVGNMLNGPWAHFMGVVARLDPSVSIEQAGAQVALLGKRIDELHQSPRDPAGASASITRLDHLRVDPAIRRSLIILFGAVSGVLLIACANVANLLLSRGTRRGKELAVRIAIGAGRGRLVRQLLTESLVLALAGGLVGVLLAVLGVPALLRLIKEAAQASQLNGLNALSLSSAGLDGAVLVFALAASALCGAIFGLAPALQASRPDLTGALKEVSRWHPHGMLSRYALVVSEIALAFMLLAGSGLMLRSLGRLLATDAGLNPRNLLTVRVSLPESHAAEAAHQFWQQLLERTGALPGVQSVAMSDCPPLIGRCYVRPFWPDGSTSGAPSPIGVHYISPNYVRTLGATIEAGREFGPGDRTGSPNVVLINQAAAARYFPGQNAIGRAVAVGGGFADGAQIIGIVSDQRFQALESPAEPDVYISHAQVPQRSGYLYLRTQHDPLSLVAAVRREAQRVDPNVPIYDVQTMEQRLGQATARTRTTGLLLSLLAGLALLLAMIGVYGVVAYAVGQRTREIGVRITLGASRSALAVLVLRHSAAVVAMGVLAGLLGAVSATGLLRSLLYEVKPLDPQVFATLVLLTVGVAALASLVPLLRAFKVDPLVALKTE